MHAEILHIMYLKRDLIDDVLSMFVFSAAFTVFIVLTVYLSVIYFLYDFIINKYCLMCKVM